MTDVSIMDLVEGNTVMLIMHASYPLSPVKNARTGRRTWEVGTKAKKPKSWDTTFFGGTVTTNDTTTGILYVSGGPNVLEGIHHILKPGAGSLPQPTDKAYTGTAEIPYGYIKQGFRIDDNADHPGERPTTSVQAHPPKTATRIVLHRR